MRSTSPPVSNMSILGDYYTPTVVTSDAATRPLIKARTVLFGPSDHEDSPPKSPFIQGDYGIKARTVLFGPLDHEDNSSHLPFIQGNYDESRQPPRIQVEPRQHFTEQHYTMSKSPFLPVDDDASRQHYTMSKSPFFQVAHDDLRHKNRNASKIPTDKGENDEDDNRSIHSSDSSYSSTKSSKDNTWVTDGNLFDDDPALAMQALLNMSGGANASTTLSLLQHHIFNQYPITPALTTLYQPSTGRRPKQSIAEIVADLNKDLLEAILAVTYEKGLSARDKLFTAFNLFTNLTKTHRSLRYAIICYIWAHHDKSKVKGPAASIIQDYALAPTAEDVQVLLKSCSEGRTCNFQLRSSLLTVDQLPGVQRLKLTLNMSTAEFEYVTSQWLILWQCLCNFICQQDFSKPTISRLDEWLMNFDISKGGHATMMDIENHEFCKKGVPVQTNLSKMHAAFLRIEAAAHHENQPARIPTNDPLKKNLLLIVVTAHKSTWVRLLHVIDTQNLNIDTMGYGTFTNLIMDAECQPSARSKLIAYVQSITNTPVITPMIAPQESKPRPQQLPTGHEPTNNDRAPLPPAVYIQQGTYILEGLIGPGVLASDAERKKAQDAGGCSNCLTFKFLKYGPHTMVTCPYTTPDCVPRSTSHIPLTVTNGLKTKHYRASDPTTVKKFIDDRKILLSKASTCTPSQAVPPIRNVIFQPVQIEEINDQDAEDADESAISVPSEPSAKGSLRAPTWQNSPGKNLRTHFMMFHINSGLLHWGD